MGLLTEPLVIVSRDEMLRRIHRDYLEMPDLRLLPAQAQRVWQLDGQTCTDLFESLIAGGLLRREDDGAYVLAVDDERALQYEDASLFESVAAGS